MSFSLEARIRYERVVAGYEGEGDVAVIRSLCSMRRLYMSGIEGYIYPRIHDGWRLYQDHLLQKLDATYSHARSGRVHSAQDVRFDGRHELPVLSIVGVGDTGAHSSIRECS